MSEAVSRHQWQGSLEWRSYRARMGNASEAAALMNCSPWFPRTPYELWLYKTGRAENEETPAMSRGQRLEPLARAFVERRFDEVYEPQVVARERISASLDGLTFDGRWALEIKCPLAGRQSDTWRYVAEFGAPPEHYWWQAQQALYCSGAQGLRFVVCHADGDEITDLIACVVRPDPIAHEVLVEAWAAFLRYLDEDEPPPLTERDLRERVDREWRDAAAAWKEARRWLEEARQAEFEARRRLIELAGDTSVQGAGIKLTRYWKRGEIDYRTATRGMDLEPFRKEGGWHYRISEQE